MLGQLFYYVAAMAVAGLGLATATRIAVLRTLATSLPLLTLVPTYLRVTANPPRGPATWRQLVRFSFPLLLAGFGAFALQQSDVIMLGVIRGSRAVGLYSPVLLTVDFVSLILYVLSTYYLPLATGIVAQGDLARLRSFYATVTKWGIVLAGPLLAALVVAPGPLLALLFGPRYGGSQAVAIARILSVGYAVTMLMGLNGVNLVALGATKAVGIRSSVGFFANILLNVVLISRFGAIGAAIGTSTVYVGLNLANSMLIWKLGRLHPIRRDVAAVVAAAVSLTMLSFVVVSLFQWSGSLKSSLFTALVVAAGCLATWAATSSRDERRAVFLAFSRKA